MLNLSLNLLIGAGNHQAVYVHPKNKKLCVKVLTDTNLVAIKKEQRNRLREINYLKRVASRSPQCTCLVQFCGIENTNLGEGAVYSLVRDENGEISVSLESYLNSFSNSHSNLDVYTHAANDLQLALLAFKNNMLENRIICRNIRPDNICVQRNHDGTIKRLVLIDNLGPSDLIPIAEYIPFLATSRIKRRWKRFVFLLRKYNNDMIFQEMLNRL